MDSDHGDPEIQVLAEGALLHHLFEIPAGGANHPDINGMGDVRAQPLNTAFLQHTQEFGLQRQGQIADFIQENRASLGFFEAAAPHLAGAGECAFFVPKSSSSIRDSGKAQAENATNGLSARWLRLWIALATTPLPVPLSPVMSTLVWTPATLPTTSFTCSIGSLLPSSPSTCMEERNFWAAAKSRARAARRHAPSKANFRA